MNVFEPHKHERGMQAQSLREEGKQMTVFFVKEIH
jgi:hypothetical protein